MTKKRSIIWGVGVAFFVLNASCNMFDPVDKPDGDEQILSEARACFDQGDIECAKEMYSQLSSAKADVAGTELAFALLEGAGVTMSTFMQAIPSGQGGKGVTKMAELLYPGSAEKRGKIFEAYRAAASIQSQELRGLIRFLAAFALVAEILGEQAGSGGLTKAHIVRDPTVCINATKASATACLTDPACSAPETSTLAAGAPYDFVNGNLSAMDLSTGNPTLGMIIGAMNAVNHAFQNELGASGKFKTGTGDFATTLLANDPVIQAPCLRYALISNEVGN